MPETYRLSRPEREGELGRQGLEQEDRRTIHSLGPCCPQSKDDRVGLIERRDRFQQHTLCQLHAGKGRSEQALCTRPSPTPRAKFLPEHPLRSWPYLQGLWKGMFRDCGSAKLERANVRGGVWLTGVWLGGVTCSWEPGRRLTPTFSKQPGAEQLASFFLSWQVGHKIDSAPRCVLWLRVQCSISLVGSRAQARGFQAGLRTISAFHSVLVEPRERTVGNIRVDGNC